MENPPPEPLPLPRRFGALPGYEGPGIVRLPWKQPAQATGGQHNSCCQCVDEAPDNAWDDAVAPYILRELEWRVWRRLPRVAAQRQWMRGRVAAKDAVRLLLWDRFRVAASLETIGILPDEYGRPQVTCATLSNAGTEMFVSISHCGNSSVALASECSKCCRGVGIDVAAPADNHDGLAEGGFSTSETALLEGWPAPERADWLLRLWCAKEAVGKARGVGLMGNPLNHIVRRVDRTEGTVEVETLTREDPAASPLDPARMTAHVGCDRGMVFGVARREEH